MTSPAFPAAIAPEIDRLVWGAHRELRTRHRDHLLEEVAAAGLDAAGPIPSIAPMVAAGRSVSLDWIVTRIRYRPRAELETMLDDAVSRGVLAAADGSLTVAAAGEALVAALLDARREAAAAMWDGTVELEPAAALVRRVVDAVDDGHWVAFDHAAATSDGDGAGRFFDDLETLRYVRQADHIAAWEAHHLTAAQMPVLTAAWKGDVIDADEGVVAALIERGLLDQSGTGITDAGREVRDRIEAETNARNEAAWTVLSDPDAEHLLELLRRLPDRVEPR